MRFGVIILHAGITWQHMVSMAKVGIFNKNQLVALRVPDLFFKTLKGNDSNQGELVG